MNSRWTENFIIFTIELVSIHSDSRIKIMVSGARRKSTPGQTWSNLVKVAKNIWKARVL